MDNKIYLHGISTQSSSFDFEKSLEKLREILRSEFLLSRRNLGLSEAQAGFNGLDYISLCDYEKRTLENGSRDMYNAYYAYIYNNLALAFPKNRFDVITPKYIDHALAGSKFGHYVMKKCGNSKKRYSDYPDEVQVRDKIDLDFLCGITYPALTHYSHLRKSLSREKTIELMLEEIEALTQLIYDYDYGNIYVYEPNSLSLIDDNMSLRRVLRYHD
ncbi:MAG: hypothetical protein IJ966_00370 [Bacilli bacterium]|jgi:phosphatidylinositol kinase/protein kinase (PI-3  family)|nr:hypothetical protein [Bacilli bacterium]